MFPKRPHGSAPERRRAVSPVALLLCNVCLALATLATLAALAATAPNTAAQATASRVANASNAPLRIINASYGHPNENNKRLNCTEIIQKLVDEDKVTFAVTNELLLNGRPDPAAGDKKSLRVLYSIGGRRMGSAKWEYQNIELLPTAIPVPNKTIFSRPEVRDAYQKSPFLGAIWVRDDAESYIFDEKGYIWVWISARKARVRGRIISFDNHENKITPFSIDGENHEIGTLTLSPDRKKMTRQAFGNNYSYTRKEVSPSPDITGTEWDSRNPGLGKIAFRAGGECERFAGNYNGKGSWRKLGGGFYATFLREGNMGMVSMFKISEDGKSIEHRWNPNDENTIWHKILPPEPIKKKEAEEPTQIHRLAGSLWEVPPANGQGAPMFIAIYPNGTLTTFANSALTRKIKTNRWDAANPMTIIVGATTVILAPNGATADEMPPPGGSVRTWRLVRRLTDAEIKYNN